MDALEREQQREELRRELAEEAKQKEEEAEQKRQRRREEAIRRRKGQTVMASATLQIATFTDIQHECSIEWHCSCGVCASLPPSEREEQQQRIRSEEDENWSKALSGELSGPRRAAIGAAEQVSEGQLSHEWVEIISAERDQELYTAMFKSE